MGFQQPANQNNVTNFSNMRSGGGNRNENWKSDGFLNLYLPTTGGGQRKVGSIPLKLSRAGDAQLIEKLRADPALVDRLKELLILEYNDATPNEDNAFAL
ncbi:hypothetical protein [Larsenimonas suaedae]|uniref:Uncharacterized protein n=1 Tax=Larsenimonas suaedae TaxID=1851019 RepID=A0ABU1GZI9_9GAMM|nr:hypothetical protein [Larsenimonas suaedae]MCM2973741.1 hypothetical protein [Larsenimonas suaedae]MDR5897265.1 hypothetical protein [Larsenimonas suaedae]